MAAAAKCKHISYDNLSGNTCRLTGASVGSDCGGAADRLLDDATDCIPRQALRYLRGDRGFFAALTQADREVVMATARTIRERMAAGLIRHEDTKETTQVTDETTDLTKLSAEQLLGLAARAKAAARERRKAEAQAEAAKPAILAERQRCMDRVSALNEALAALDQGESVDLRTLGVKVKPGCQPREARGPSPAAGKSPHLTPDERYARAVRVLERHAKRDGWSAKKLAEAKARARKKAAT